MKNVTLDKIEWIESPNYTEGRTQDVRAIVIHWWGDPANNPSMDGVINYFQNSSNQVSAHFVVSGDRIVQMVNMGNQAWHAMQANAFGVGIEVDPNTPGNTYETVGALVEFIRGYYENVPLKKHSDYVATQCPGTIDLNKIEDHARGRVKDEPTQVEKLKRKVNQLTELAESRLKQIETLRKRRDKAQGEVTELKKQVKHRDTQLEHLENNLSQAETELNAANRKNEELAEEVQKLKEQQSDTPAIKVFSNTDLIKELFKRLLGGKDETSQ